MEDLLEAGRSFEKIVEKLLKHNEYTISETRPTNADLLIKKGNNTWVVEAKFYKTQRPQLKLLSNAANQIRLAMAKNNARGMLIASCIISAEQREHLRRSYAITVLDRQQLFHLASASPELTEELYANLEIDPTDHAATLEDFYGSEFGEQENAILNLPPDLDAEPSEAIDTRGSDLSEELRAIAPGRAQWSDFETTCEKILKYLFADHLAGWNPQHRTDDELNRFDYVCRIKPSTDFWNFLIQHLQSRYIIFEFKNYEEPIRQGQVLTTEKYLLEKGLRRVAIMLTRKGAHASATKMAQGAMRESGKLIIVLDDDQIIKMLHMKEKGSDPTDLLFELTDNFLLSLPR
ncbi:restriction endonuclease [Pseudomonas sp. TNT2022 ID1044]|uniref:restriction endonuclease n=1 Tax=Pseudomonas sp. TNT2022 ID1044 TaxID=2942636 RepID=UPI00235E4960|nr:restriction endonuclease [Pseudomonas sp. TNT2022 ID1044]MDD0998475.1 restriction endonuclease [Pseudomonas sp. TNT2022 ID1044]